MFDLSSTTRGSLRWGWDGVAQPVVEYILLAFAVVVFLVVWVKWFYYPGFVPAGARAQDNLLPVPVQQQSATYGSVPVARGNGRVAKLSAKTKQKTLAHHAHHAHTVPTRTPTRTETSGLNVFNFGRAPPAKVGTISHYATQHNFVDHHNGAPSTQILFSGETHDEPQSFYPNQSLPPAQTAYRQNSTSRGGRGHASTMHFDHAQTTPTPTPPPLRMPTIPAFVAHPQSDSPIDDDPSFAHIDREWERLHLHGAPSGRNSYSGSEGDDDLIDATLQEGPAKRYREKAREEARYRRAAFEASKKAYRANRKGEAKQLSDQGKMHDENVRRYNSMAAAEIFRLNNPRYSTTQRYSRCDLHGLHIEEAKQYADSHVQTCYHAGVEKTMLIVGKGHHSLRGSARIKPAILDMMRGRPGILAGTHEKNEGCIVIEFVRQQRGSR